MSVLWQGCSLNIEGRRVNCKVRKNVVLPFTVSNRITYWMSSGGGTIIHRAIDTKNPVLFFFYEEAIWCTTGPHGHSAASLSLWMPVTCVPPGFQLFAATPSFSVFVFCSYFFGLFCFPSGANFVLLQSLLTFLYIHFLRLFFFFAVRLKQTTL